MMAELQEACEREAAPRVTVAEREYLLLWKPEDSPEARSFERLLAAAFQPGGIEREATGRAILAQLMLLSPRLLSIGWHRIRAAATAAASGGDAEEARRLGRACLRRGPQTGERQGGAARGRPQAGPRRGRAECHRAGDGHARVGGHDAGGDLRWPARVRPHGVQVRRQKKYVLTFKPPSETRDRTTPGSDQRDCPPPSLALSAQDSVPR